MRHVIVGLLITIALYAVSWIATCGFIWLITLCFVWPFSWLIATGVWLVLCIIRSIFRR